MTIDLDLDGKSYAVRFVSGVPVRAMRRFIRNGNLVLADLRSDEARLSAMLFRLAEAELRRRKAAS